MGQLTALQVRAAKEPGRYQGGDGLMLVVKPSGSRSWALRIQVNGRRREFGLGAAKDVSLAAARSKAHEIRTLYRSGVDPVAARRASMREAEGIPDFEVAARRVHEERTPG
ncbi:MAG: Arm DNA-binding domain-containing protein, partial [Pseudomonadota bacterium]